MCPKLAGGYKLASTFTFGTDLILIFQIVQCSVSYYYLNIDFFKTFLG